MKNNFKRKDFPLAFTMLDMAKRIKPRRDGRHNYDKYFLMWTAFQQFFTALSNCAGVRTELEYTPDGNVRVEQIGNVMMPMVNSVREEEQLLKVVSALGPVTKIALLAHSGTNYFRTRIPFWQGKPVEFDALGQRLNGVIDISRTTSINYPVWSPIDVQLFDQANQPPHDPSSLDFVVHQILLLLATVRRNLLQFSRSFDDSTDAAVINNALPLLEAFIDALTN